MSGSSVCRGYAAGVSVSGFHAWRRAIPTVQSRAEAEAALRGHIGRVFAAKRRVYGKRRSVALLPARG
jgi:hypothetical protein